MAERKTNNIVVKGYGFRAGTILRPKIEVQAPLDLGAAVISTMVLDIDDESETLFLDIKGED